MNTAKANETVRNIRALIGKNEIAEALTALVEYFTSLKDKAKLNDVIALQARLYGLQQAVARGTVSEAEAGIQRGQICNSVLILLDGIAPDEAEPEPSKPVRKGKLLHNIPEEMCLGEVIECRVRIATSEKLLRKNFAGAGHVETIPLERIGDHMEVDLVASESDAFVIKRQNRHARQFVDPDVHTEWVFDVIPMKTGPQKLYLKVDIIMREKGKKSYRDEVISVPVEVNTTEPAGGATKWKEAANIQAKATKNFLAKMLGGLGARKNRGRVAATLLVAVIGVVLAQWLFSDNFGNLWAWPPTPADGLHRVSVYVHSPTDSIAEEFTVSNLNVPLKSIIPGVFGGLARVPDDYTRHSIYYRGNSASKYWENITLKDSVCHLYVFQAQDTMTCGVYVTVDTVLQPVEYWQLIWQKNTLEREYFSVLPMSDTSFFVPLGPYCTALYDPNARYDFIFQNGNLRYSARSVSLAEYPWTLIFKHVQQSRGITTLGADPVPQTPQVYSTQYLTLLFSQPVVFGGLIVNGRAVNSQHYTTFDAADDPKRKAGLRLQINAETLGAGNPQTLDVGISSTDCKCQEKQIDLGSGSTEIRETIQCDKIGGVKKPVINLKKSKIALTIPPHLAKSIQDMEITVDGSTFSKTLPIKDGVIPFEVDRLDKRVRNICLGVRGSSSGELINLACYEGTLDPEMSMEVQLPEGRIVRR